MRLLSLAAIAALCCTAAAANGGVAVGLSAAGINYLIKQVLPVVEKGFTNVTIAGISGTASGFDYSLEDLHCPTFTINSFTVSFKPPNDVGIALDDLTLQCGAAYWYKPHGWPDIFKEKGSVTINAGKTTADLDVTMSEKAGDVQVSSTSATLSLGALAISFNGNWLDWLINLLKPFIEKAITSGFESKFPTIIQTIATNIDLKLSSVPTFTALKIAAPYNIAEVRYGLVEAPVAEVGFIGMQIQGDVVPLGFNGIPPITPAHLPMFDASTSTNYMELQISPYTVMSTVWTFYQAGLINFDIPTSSLPGGFNTTAVYGLIVPGFPSKYPGGAVSLDVAMLTLPAIELVPTGGSLVLPLTFSFSVVPVGQSQPVFGFDFVANVNVSMDLTVGVGADKGLVVGGDLEYLSTDIVPGNSTCGPESGLPLMQQLIGFVLSDLLLPAVNKVLAAGISLPAFPDVAFTAASLTSGDGFALLGLTFTLAVGDELLVPAGGAPVVALE